MEIMDYLNGIMDKLRKFAGVEFCFGNPQTVGDLTLIPVARLAYGLGGGSGTASGRKKKPQEHAIDESSEEMIETADPEPAKSEATGMGGGGGMQTVPLGIFIIRKDKVSFRPVVSFKEAAVAAGILLLLLWRIFRKK